MYRNKISRIFTQIGLLGFIMLPPVVSGQEWVDWNLFEYSDIAIHPDSSHILYIGTGSNYTTHRTGALMVSNDNGYTLDTLFAELSVAEIEFHPDSPDTFFMALHTPNFTRPGILKVVRSGAEYDTTWVNDGIHLGLYISVTCIEIDPLSPDTMLAGTANFGEGHIWRTIDGGQTWNDANPTRTHDVIIIEHKPSSPNEIFYSAGGQLLFRSADWGETWTEAGEWGEEWETISSMVFFPEAPTHILITVFGGGAYISEDNGDSWNRWSTQIPSQMVRNIIVDPLNANNLYLATNDSIFFSSDNGTSWDDYTFGYDQLSTMNNRLVLDSSNNRLFAGSHRTSLFSLDLNTVSINSDAPEIINSSLELVLFPNPSNSSVSISLFSQFPGELTIEIYNILGRKILEQTVSARAGQNRILIEGVSGGSYAFPSGTYLVKSRIQDSSFVGKIILVK